MRCNKNLRNEVWKIKYGEEKKKNGNRFEREEKVFEWSKHEGNKNKNTLKCNKKNLRKWLRW